MGEQLFLFIQMEFPWALGPPDSRYLLRPRAGAEAERVVVLGTLGAGRASIGRRSSGRASGGRRRWPMSARARPRATPEPAPVTTARATIVDPTSVSAERQAQAWLSDLDAEREARAAVAVLNRVLYSYRIATADPYIHEVSPAQALVIRAGWGEGEQVADGRWLYACELPWAPSGRRSAGTRRLGGGGRSAALRPQERLAELLGGRGASLVSEELALRARLDLDQGRLLHAAVELDRAFAAALPELRAEGRQDLAIRIAELEKLLAGVRLQARAALGDEADGAAGARDSAEPAGATGAPGSSGAKSEPEEDVIRHALERLEAALRARTAHGSRLR
jgi:hypothetical protein